MLDPMIDAAIAARARSYSPYSRFAVGSAVRCERGLIHAGCNVENAAYPEGVCAEAGAISAMIVSGGRRIEAVVVAGGGGTPCMPCGGCRQKLREFAAPDIPVTVVDETGTVLMVRTLADLLPDSFGSEALV
jgi:cytidine deaminase